MLKPPSGTAPYSRTPTFTEDTVPKALLAHHSTKDGVWGVIHVLEGALRYVISDDDLDTVLNPETQGLIEPERLHRIQPLGKVSFYVEFWR